MIKVAGMLGIPYVSSTSGQNPTIGLDENVKLFGKVYRELIKVAEDNNVRIVFENCLHGYPAGMNIAVNPGFRATGTLIGQDSSGFCAKQDSTVMS